jgi:hypothetical protein
VIRRHPRRAATGVMITSAESKAATNADGAAPLKGAKCKVGFDLSGFPQAIGRAERKLWAEVDNRGMAMATKSGIWP